MFWAFFDYSIWALFDSFILHVQQPPSPRHYLGSHKQIKASWILFRHDKLIFWALAELWRRTGFPGTTQTVSVLGKPKKVWIFALVTTMFFSLYIYVLIIFNITFSQYPIFYKLVGGNCPSLKIPTIFLAFLRCIWFEKTKRLNWSATKIFCSRKDAKVLEIDEEDQFQYIREAKK